MVKLLLSVAMTFGSIVLFGCGSSEQTTSMPVEERFRQAKELFDDEKYLEAINEFTIITLQNQGSAFADSAQFFIAESRYNRHEYLVAATEYNYLKRSFPSSPLLPEAQYKLAMSYYNLSPQSALDQQYTSKAIDELQTFVEYYPLNAHVADASERIMELNSRLAKKTYETARLYETMEYYKSAIFYFDDIIERYHDTDFAPLAYLGKVEVLIIRKKYDDAKAALRRFYDRFPNSVLKSQADKLRETIEKNLEGNSQVSGTSTDGMSRTSGLTKQQEPTH